ncbi:MAG: hypothetical protein ACYDH6_08685 [Acidimicrobiales bacterium]
MTGPVCFFLPDGSLSIEGERVIPIVEGACATFYACGCVIARTTGVCSHGLTAIDFVKQVGLRDEGLALEREVDDEATRWLQLAGRLDGEMAVA